MKKIILTIAEQIERAKDGRSQTWIVNKMNEDGIVISDVQFSRKKKGVHNFTDDELISLNKILDIDLKY